MRAGLQVGHRQTREILVTEAMCPHFDGVLVHPVYATWTLVHDMEVTGRAVLAPYLEPHEEGLGIHISVDHQAPALIGARVTVTAEVTDVTPHRLACRMTAASGGRLLAKGTFVQAIVPKARLQVLFERHRPSDPT